MHAAQRDLAYFGLPGFYTPRTDFWTAPSWTYVYDTRPLLVTLARYVDFAALNASATAFAVTAVEVVTGTLRAFVNQPLGKVPATKIEPRHVLASGSLPPWFPLRRLTSGCAPGWTKRAATRSSTPSSTSTCRIRPPRSFPPRRIRPTTRMECAISPRRPWAAGAGTGSNSRTTSCGLRSRVAGVWRMRRSRQGVKVQLRQDRWHAPP